VVVELQLLGGLVTEQPVVFGEQRPDLVLDLALGPAADDDQLVTLPGQILPAGPALHTLHGVPLVIHQGEHDR
jgi:hypothetical protein